MPSDDKTTIHNPQIAVAEQLWNMRCDCEHPDKNDWGWHAISQHHPEIAKEYLDMAGLILTAADGATELP